MAENTSETITAAEYITSQLELEHEAREVLPYSFDTCTYLQGPLRQPIYSCKTHHQPNGLGAAVCYSCSISCHSECELVELFTKRNVQCDCGTTRTPGFACTLRKTRDDIPGEENVYCHNYDGRFCDCDQLYDVGKESGTMYQCLLGDVCNEDWYHDGCIVGIKKGEENRKENASESSKPKGIIGTVLDSAKKAAEKVGQSEASGPVVEATTVSNVLGSAQQAAEKVGQSETPGAVLDKDITMENVMESAEQAANKVSQSEAPGAIVDAKNITMDKVLDSAKEAVEQVGQSEAPGAVLDAKNITVDKVVESAKTAAEKVVQSEAPGDVLMEDALPEKVQTFVENVQEMAGDIVDNIQEKAGDIVDNIQERAGEAAEKVSDILTTAGQAAERVIQSEAPTDLPTTSSSKDSEQKTESIVTDIQQKAEKAADDLEQVEEEEEVDPRLAILPSDEEFESYICWKCIEANPWLKHYSGRPGFLPAVPHDEGSLAVTALVQANAEEAVKTEESRGIKRKSPDSEEVQPEKRVKQEDTDTAVSTSHKTTTTVLLELDPSTSEPAEVVGRRTIAEDKTTTVETTTTTTTTTEPKTCLLPSTPPPPQPISLFLKDDFRQHLCQCPSCTKLYEKHPILTTDIPSYSPPLSRASTPSIHSSSGSLLERGEKALNTMDRVKAIEGVMAYNSLRDKVKEFLKPFAESGKEVGAEDVKAYFEALRGDAKAGRDDGGEGEAGDGRQEQSGY
ncbi:hypothetical protein BJ508DRAFT_412642 [Ascobolus immersus RN42]|uniref:UBR-type domain-containing protein n=1 Tax=Ascobolus immersus RN42 TaxID=1160509 RepID=A0A3N4IEN3_ASCIM|nr:hypothetical protein BJ508DRAFT_412642 [Ascobolus immersus RN42]